MSEKHTTRRRYITGKLIQRPADLMSAFLDSSTTPFCAVDNRGEFVVFNKACELLTGYSYEEMAGRSFFSLFEPSRHKELAETWATRGQRPDSSGEIDLPWVGKDGSVHTVRWFFTRLADTLGNAEFYAGIGQDVTQKTHAQDALRESEARYRAMFEHNQAIKILIDPSNGSIVDANTAACRFYGYTREKLKTMSVYEVNTLSQAEILAEMEAARSAKRLYFQFPHRLANGEIREVEVYSGPIEVGGRSLLYSIIHDITERKLYQQRLEASELRFRMLVEEATEAICMADNQGRNIEANSRACELFGYTREEFAKLSVADTVPPEDRALIGARFAEMKKGIPQRWERDLLRKNGKRLPVEISARFLPDGRLMAIMRDVTERKRAEEALRESESRFRQLADAAPVFIWLANARGERTYFSKGWSEFTGRALDDEIGEGWLSGVHAEDSHRVPDMLADALQSHQDFTLEYRLRASDGEYRWVLDRGVPRFSEKGDFAGYIGSCLDITERKRAENALAERERHYRELMEQSGDGILIFDERAHITDVNTRFCEILGYSRAEMLRLNPTSLVDGSSHSRIPLRYSQMDAGETLRIESDLICKDGRRVPMDISARRVGKGRYQAVFRDMTERKRVELALRESQRRLSTLLSNLPGMAYRCLNNPDWSMEFVSEGGAELTGYSLDELHSGKVSYGTHIIHKEDQQRIWDEVQAALARKQGFTLSYRIVRRNGSERWVWEQGRGIYSETGELIALEGFVTDVTERRQAEEALRQSQQRYQAFIAQSTEGVWRFEFEQPIDLSLDIDTQVDLALQGGILAECNDEMAKMYGYSRAEEIIGVRIVQLLDMSDPANRETFRVFARARYRITDLESHEIGRNGEHHYFLNNVVGIIENGKLIRIWGTQRDVTAQRAAAQALSESEERFKRLASATEEAIIIHADGRVIDANLRASEMSGYPMSELVGLDIRKITAPQSWEKVQAAIASGFEGTNEYIGLRKDGSEFPCELTSRQIKLSGREVRVVAIRDITERKRAERALQESEERYRRLSRATAEAILIHEQGRILDANQRAADMFRYPPEALLKLNAFELASPESRATVINNVRNGVETPYEAEGMRMDGSRFPGEITARNLELGGKQVRVVAIRDITERKRAEEALRREAGIVRLMQRVAMAANESSSSQAAIRLCIDEICAYTGWPLGHAYFVDGASGELVPADIWHLDTPALHAEFKAMNMSTRFAAGVGLPGAVLRDRKPYWIDDVARDSRFPGGRTRTGLGIVSGFAFPVLVGREVVAVLEFGSAAPAPSDAQLLEIMGNIGTQLGRVVERERANELLEARVAERTAQLEQANRELSRRAIDLESINKELEAFSYSVSHDLRAPLRGIFGFSQALQEDHGEKLGPEGAAVLERVKTASQRMGRLIDDLLGLSRVTRAEMVRDTVDLSAMAAEICTELRKTYAGRQVEVVIQPGISAVGDARMLRILMQNLLDNAFKFTARKENARITFSTEQTEQGLAYTVSDNGAGFDMQYAQKLFGAFQRLHSMKEFEGTGIGLATVQRIVHRHGGRVRAQGVPNEGASIQFTLGQAGL